MDCTGIRSERLKTLKEEMLPESQREGGMEEGREGEREGKKGEHGGCIGVVR